MTRGRARRAAGRTAAVACILGAALGAFRARAVEVVRIAVVVGAERVELSGQDLLARPFRGGAEPVRARGGTAQVTLQRGELRLGGIPLDPDGASFQARGPIRVAGLALGGEVEVRRARGGLAVVHALPLEEYVEVVAGSEMPASFPPQALRAQAVAARTYAVFKKLEAVREGRPWHLGATVLDQVYHHGPVDPRARAAARDTAGEVLVFEHLAIEAYFHSTCGGRTESGADALGRDRPYLASVECDRCRASPMWRWTVRIPAEALGRAAKLAGAASGARVVSRTATGRAERVEVAGRGGRATLGAVELRRRVGYGKLPSLAFDAHPGLERGAVVLDGAGSGHGAGMCQWGAAGFAREGKDYRAILAHYYRGAEILRMY